MFSECMLLARIPLKRVKTLLSLEIVSVEKGLFYGVFLLFTRTKSQVQILYRPLCLKPFAVAVSANPGAFPGAAPNDGFREILSRNPSKGPLPCPVPANPRLRTCTTHNPVAPALS